MSTDSPGEGDITNTLIYNTLIGDIMPTLMTIREHLARLNGRVDHLQDRATAHTGRLGAVEDDCTELSTRLGRMEGAEGARGEQVQDAKARHAVLDNRVFNLAVEIAKWGAVGIGVFAGLTKGLAALADAFRP